MNAGARAVGLFTARSMSPTAPPTRQVPTGDTGEETVVSVNGQATDARSPEGAATPDASSKRLDEMTSSADPRSRISRA